jgi:mannosyltransferase
MSVRTDRFWLAAILALALALRFPVLNGPLWYDEIVTVETHLKMGWGAMLSDYSMNHHYLHNIAAKAAMDLFGAAPWAIRLPALIFGLLGIWAIWRLARDAGGSMVAHATALLVALSYHHIWFRRTRAATRGWRSSRRSG